MTKTNIFGQSKKQRYKKKKYIQFIGALRFYNGKFDTPGMKPRDWDNVMLIRTAVEYDYMYAWKDGEEGGGDLYRGHWNDGVVEE